MTLGTKVYAKTNAVLQPEFEKGQGVPVACKGTLRREATRRGWVWEVGSPLPQGGFGGPPPRKFRP